MELVETTMELTVVLWDQELDWARLRCTHGDARTVPAALDALVRSEDQEQAQNAYWRLDNVVVVQGSVFEAGPAVVEPLIRALVIAGPHGRRMALELLLQLVGGWTDPSETDRLGRDLAAECRERASAGLEVFYAIAAGVDRVCRELACEIARAAETRDGEFSRRIRWLASMLTPEDAQYLLGLI